MMLLHLFLCCRMLLYLTCGARSVPNTNKMDGVSALESQNNNRSIFIYYYMRIFEKMIFWLVLKLGISYNNRVIIIIS
jgi:hypothetical protein